MDIGFAVPVSGSWATPLAMTRVARRAEELGYASLWAFQRLLSPVDGAWGEQYRSVTDPLVTLAYLAGQTSRVRLGVAVVNAPFLPPVLLAKQFATLDLISGGRLDAGLGIGWSPEEFAATGMAMARRGRRSEEYVAVLKTLWTDEPVEHTGEFYRVPRMSARPKPVQRPHPPILLGGGVPAALRRAGRLADGWVCGSGPDLAAIGDQVRTVREAAESAGRNPDDLRMVCRGSVRVRPAGAVDREPLTGSPAEIRDDFGRLAGCGITELFVDLNFDPEIGSPSADPAESMRRAEAALEAFAPAR
ncbi:LLM class F420-dependent oxidoreductase [Rhizomonospora bruguierae]|uniref:LLM class F420-dependent oxidoreductase n=1 Tax=Rhizomonospora bruguierae TaxID=1581705 RepID=UPI0020BEBF25|nr:LLM class F420-dependent oxidoreductase [Micromonospora sp. NBRC 107566]